MPKIIHTVLYEKLRILPEWLSFREDFELLCGLPVELREEQAAEESILQVEVEVRGITLGFITADTAQHGDPPPLSRRKKEACRHLMTLAAERFSTLLASSHTHDHGKMPGPVLKTCRWIQQRALQGEVRLTEAAAFCGFSASHLSRLFHGSTGMTFQEYVTRFRLQKASSLLLTTESPVTRIAFDSGFQSISQFHRAFRRVYATTPRDYRNSHS
ncbi:MAG: helix-turn-helix transcriptional regulator [Oceanipulchritudo sp.]